MLWLLARGSYLLLPGSAPALLANAVFRAMLAWLVVSQFVKGAKKWHNQTMAPLLMAPKTENSEPDSI